MKRTDSSDEQTIQAAMALEGELLLKEMEFTLEDVCRSCMLASEEVAALVEEGVLEVHGKDSAQWRFRVSSFRRIRTAIRLQHDLGVNLAGAALALELLDRIAELERSTHHTGSR